MGIVEKECARMQRDLHDAAMDKNLAKLTMLYVAQQCLNFALAPTGFKSPYQVILDLSEDNYLNTWGRK